jgi:hypothetical protein
MTNRLHRKAALAIFGLALIGLSTAAPSQGGEDSNRTTHLTFSKPVALPGVSLPAGTYIFERASPYNAIDVVRVSSEDRRFVYYAGFTELVPRPARRAPLVTFGEAVAGAALPIKEWYPIDSGSGHRFIYR